jgi:hypothetical protein
MVWVGSLLTIGYGVAPTLFSTLDPVSAGDLAAKLFRGEAIVGVLCGILALALGNVLVRRGAFAYRRFRWLLIGMLACVLIGYFAIAPFMEALRQEARNAGIDVMQLAPTRFMLLHGVSSVFYLIESLLGIALVWLLPVGERRGEIDSVQSRQDEGASADRTARVDGSRQ